MNWQDILAIIIPLGGLLSWIYSRIDKRFDEMKLEINKIKTESATDIKEIRSDLGILNTRIAVIESKLSDISTNVTHLMWHHQSLPQKDAREE